jgi:cytochrome c oxidase cbb3-type subunit 3
MKYLIIFVSFFLTLVIIPAYAQNTGDPYIGKRLYKSFCLVCHGSSGDSKGPLAKKLNLHPTNLASEKYQKKSVAEMAKIIGGYGRVEGSTMPVWRDVLPESNIKNIASYLALIKIKSLRFKGDKRQGRLIFNSSCAACHGPMGKGRGILAKIIGAPMVDFTKRESLKHLSDNKLILIIKEGAGELMPGWEGTLNNDEIINVAAYVRSLGK